MKKIFNLWILVILVAGCKTDYSDILEMPDNASVKRTVRAEQVPLTQDPIPIYAIGKVASDTELKLSFKIGGIISTVNADEGDYISRGTTLAAIRRNEIDAQVLKAERALEKAERDLDRIQRMYADSAATLENVQDLTTLSEVARADLEIAKFNQEYATIVSPVNGRILKRLAEPNELISPGQPIFILGSNTGASYVLKVSLSDRDISRLRPGDPAKTRFDAFPEETIEGSVGQIAESADPVTGTFDVDIILNTRVKRFRNGYIGRAELLPTLKRTYWKIPMDAIVEGNEKSVTIFKIQKDSIAREVIMTPFYVNGEFIAVEQHDPGVDIIEVVTEGGQYLTSGDSVEIQ